MSDEPYVGGHPEMPLHPYEPTGDGTCAACVRATSDLVREVLVGHVVVTDKPHPPPSNETYCASCSHGKTHHGHYDGERGEWVDDGKCFVWMDAPRGPTGRKRGPSGCRCKGWES